MIRNYLKVVLRNLLKNKLFSIINILGLTLGLSATGLLFLYVSYELSYDRYHSKVDQIYRLNHTRFVEGEVQYTSATVFPEIGLELAKQFEAIEGVARMFDVASEFEPVFEYGSYGEQVTFSEASLYLADSTFLEIFDVNLIESTGENPLSQKNTLIISKSLATKVFNNTNVVGKLLDWKGMGTYEITGVFDDLPANSHMKFEVLVSWFNVYGDMSLKRWDRFYNYILVNEKADIEELASQIQQFSSEYLKEYNEPRSMGSEISLQPLREIHLTSKLQNELQPNGDKQTTYGLLAVTLLILFLAVINYVNLATSKAMERAKEVGIRKVIGSLKAQLIGQFLLESFLLIFVSTVLAITATQLIIPHLNQWLEVSIVVDYWSRIDFWLAILISVIFLTMTSGLYPAFIMSSFRPITLVKGIGKSNKKFGLRSLLISFQFAISLFLIVCTIIIYSQVSLVSNQDTGFRKDQVLVINLLELLTDFRDSTYEGRLETFKYRLKAYETIEAATVTSQVPGKKSTWRGTESTRNESRVVSYRTRIDPDFAHVFNIPLVAGRFFIPEDERSSQRYMVVNESWVKATGFSSEDDAIGQITDMGVDYEIIGVIEDFHQISPK
ncbi:MAG: ABC transporter permease, partial [Bacteroidota bacterium]